jgi:hypothetical protein
LHGGGGRRDARRRRRRRSLGRQGSSSLPCGSCARRAGLTQPPARAGRVRYEYEWTCCNQKKTAEAAGDLRFRVGFVGLTRLGLRCVALRWFRRLHAAGGGRLFLALACVSYPIGTPDLTYLPGVRPRPHPLSWHVAVVTVPSTSRLFFFPSHLPPWRPSIF